MSTPVKRPPAPAKVTTPSEREIRVERVFNAPRERVWRAMTDPEQLAQWWGRGNRLVVERLELERGGHWRFVEHAGGEEHGFEGQFGEITPPSRMVQTFGWDGMPAHPCRVDMTLEDLGDGRTRLVSITTFFTTEERDGMMEAGMEQGMNKSYAALDRLLEGAG
ncbi:MAG: SRPBCC family protein [Gemmatimonadetes bacterium]|nr:SRPBCC family protein [Gemmatimonadota bacterium]